MIRAKCVKVFQTVPATHKQTLPTLIRHTNLVTHNRFKLNLRDIFRFIFGEFRMTFSHKIIPQNKVQKKSLFNNTDPKIILVMRPSGQWNGGVSAVSTGTIFPTLKSSLSLFFFCVCVCVKIQIWNPSFNQSC